MQPQNGLIESIAGLNYIVMGNRVVRVERNAQGEAWMPDRHKFARKFWPREDSAIGQHVNMRIWAGISECLEQSENPSAQQRRFPTCDTEIFRSRGNHADHLKIGGEKVLCIVCVLRRLTAHETVAAAALSTENGIVC